MQTRSVKAIHSAVREDVEGLVTRRALPTSSVRFLDPFLFLNHHGPQTYAPDNQGLPFGPHPHRGFETVTFILSGDIEHQDSAGHRSVIRAGGVQWMTAGRGVIHSELSSVDFLRDGGELEILQLWVNLPSILKMTAPRYVGLQSNEIPIVGLAPGVQGHLVAGNACGVAGPIPSLTGLHLMTVHMEADRPLSQTVASDRTIFFYVIRGSVRIGNSLVERFQLVEFDQDGDEITFSSDSDAIVVFGHGHPFNEPIVARGPFVMNSEEEIHQAFQDFRSGRFEEPS